MFDAKTEAYLRRTHSTSQVDHRPSTVVAAVLAANMALLMGLLLYLIL